MLAASDSYYYYALCFIFCCNQTTMLTGNIVALITPMLENGDVDFCSLKNLVEYHIRSHTSALAILGTTGESCAFDPEEHVSIVKQVIEFADGSIDIIASTGGFTTPLVITFIFKYARTPRKQSCGINHRACRGIRLRD